MSVSMIQASTTQRPAVAPIEVTPKTSSDSTKSRSARSNYSRPTALYRHYDAEGTLLYVGISLNAAARLAQHREHATWYSQITSVTIEKFDSRDEALAAETVAIRKESPRYNIRKMLAADPDLAEAIGSPDTEETDQSMVTLDNS